MVRHPDRLHQSQPSHPGHRKRSARRPRFRRSLRSLGEEVILLACRCDGCCGICRRIAGSGAADPADAATSLRLALTLENVECRVQ